MPRVSIEVHEASNSAAMLDSLLGIARGYDRLDPGSIRGRATRLEESRGPKDGEDRPAAIRACDRRELTSLWAVRPRIEQADTSLDSPARRIETSGGVKPSARRDPGYPPEAPSSGGWGAVRQARMPPDRVTALLPGHGRRAAPHGRQAGSPGLACLGSPGMGSTGGIGQGHLSLGLGRVAGWGVRAGSASLGFS